MRVSRGEEAGLPFDFALGKKDPFLRQGKSALRSNLKLCTPTRHRRYFFFFFFSSITAWAAARRLMGTRKGDALT